MRSSDRHAKQNRPAASSAQIGHENDKQLARKWPSELLVVAHATLMISNVWFMFISL